MALVAARSELAGGTAGWHRAGLPVVSGDTSQADIRLTEIVGPH